MDREDWQVSFGERLRFARESMGMSQGQAAIAARLHRSSICGWERGVHEPSAWAVLVLADIYGVSADWLLGRCQR